MVLVLIVMTVRWCRKGKRKCIDIPIHYRLVGSTSIMIFLRFVVVSRPPCSCEQQESKFRDDGEIIWHAKVDGLMIVMIRSGYE